MAVGRVVHGATNLAAHWAMPAATAAALEARAVRSKTSSPRATEDPLDVDPEIRDPESLERATWVIQVQNRGLFTARWINLTRPLV